MVATNSDPLTAMLSSFRRGESGADSRLPQRVYDDLHRRARNLLRHDRLRDDLAATEVIAELYGRLVKQRWKRFEHRDHFFAIAATFMREILVDYARRARAKKRGGGRVNLRLDDPGVDRDAGARVNPQYDDAIALGEALEALEVINPRQCRILEMVFARMPSEEIAREIDLSVSMVRSERRAALRWSAKYLGR